MTDSLKHTPACELDRDNRINKLSAPSEAAMHGLDYESKPSEDAMREAVSFLRIACLGTDVCVEYNKRCVCALRLARLIELHAAAQREKDAKIADSMDGRLWYEIAAAIRSAP